MPDLAAETELAAVTELAGCGRRAPVIGHAYALGDATEAVRHVERGHAPGRRSSPCGEPVGAHGRRTRAALRHHLDTVR
ncbi:hypothetical protein ABZ465_10650 [Streptomyces griseoincarnatus]